MPALSTHVLDTAIGRPAAGLQVELYRLHADARQKVAEGVTDADGRLALRPADGGELPGGEHELVFHAGAYFANRGAEISEPFLDRVPVRFRMADKGRCHVPLLVAPCGYSSYRGS